MALFSLRNEWEGGNGKGFVAHAGSAQPPEHAAKPFQLYTAAYVAGALQGCIWLGSDQAPFPVLNGWSTNAGDAQA